MDRMNPGDDVLIVGTMLRHWRPLSKGMRCEVDIALLANSATVLNARERLSSLTLENRKVFSDYWLNFQAQGRELFARNNIIRAVCPQLYGLYGVKLALLLTLIGGSDPAKRNQAVGDEDRILPHATEIATSDCTESPAMRTRCQSHLLIGILILRVIQ